MKKISAFGLITGAMLFFAAAGAAEINATDSLVSEALFLHQKAYAVLVQAGKAMEEPFSAAFDPQLCVQEASAIRAFLDKSKTRIPPPLSRILEEEEKLLAMAMDYFKALGTVRPSLNALTLPQKQYNATKIKESFTARLAVLADKIRAL